MKTVTLSAFMVVLGAIAVACSDEPAPAASLEEDVTDAGSAKPPTGADAGTSPPDARDGADAGDPSDAGPHEPPLPPRPGKSISFPLMPTGASSLQCVDLDVGAASTSKACEHAPATELRLVVGGDVIPLVDISGPANLCRLAGSFATVDDIPTDYASGCKTWNASALSVPPGTGIIVADATGTHHWRVLLFELVSFVPTGSDVAGLFVTLEYDAID